MDNIEEIRVSKICMHFWYILIINNGSELYLFNNLQFHFIIYIYI